MRRGGLRPISRVTVVAPAATKTPACQPKRTIAATAKTNPSVTPPASTPSIGTGNRSATTMTDEEAEDRQQLPETVRLLHERAHGRSYGRGPRHTDGDHERKDSARKSGGATHRPAAAEVAACRLATLRCSERAGRAAVPSTTCLPPQGRDGYQPKLVTSVLRLVTCTRPKPTSIATSASATTSVTSLRLPLQHVFLQSQRSRTPDEEILSHGPHPFKSPEGVIVSFQSPSLDGISR